MNKRLIWVDGDDDFCGWCCSQCTWGVAAPRLESTVAALAFNRVAQDDFEKQCLLHTLDRKVMFLMSRCGGWYDNAAIA